jgi:uncharacterized protein (DUF2249 family)
VIQDFDPALVTELDVRELLATGQEPLQLLLEHAVALPAGGVLHVRSPFEPVPLFHLMAERGFVWRSRQYGEQDWSSWFWRADQPPAPAREAAPVEHDPVPSGVTDLRPMTPPEPLLWILRWTAGADATATLRVMLPFFPAPLPELLAGSGWQLVLEEERGDGVVVRVAKR